MEVRIENPVSFLCHFARFVEGFDEGRSRCAFGTSIKLKPAIEVPLKLDTQKDISKSTYAACSTRILQDQEKGADAELARTHEPSVPFQSLCRRDLQKLNNSTTMVVRQRWSLQLFFCIAALSVLITNVNASYGDRLPEFQQCVEVQDPAPPL